ncbi:MAG: MraY family glycosyltransferase [Bacteroidales bacterium]|nr:MraY family glycosyltransferase [Bacteroidales bacterium]
MYQFNILPDEIRLIAATIFAFAIGWTFRKQLFLIAVRNKFFARTSRRSSHSGHVPAVGGCLIFLSFICSFLLFSQVGKVPSFQYALLGSMITFFIGFYDDLTNISPIKKLFGEIVAVALLVFGGNYFFTDLHGLFGADIIPPSLGIALTFITFIGLINAMNLIDGVNGLASGIMMMDCFAFGAWFYYKGNIEHAILCGILIGAIAPFFIYNVFGQRSKMFMGDSGSLVIGFLLSFLVIQFCETQLDGNKMPLRISAPGISFSIMALPVLDTIRLMAFRWMQGKSPFFPDKNHMHHKLLTNFINNHIKVTATML